MDYQIMRLGGKANDFPFPRPCPSCQVYGSDRMVLGAMMESI